MVLNPSFALEVSKKHSDHMGSLREVDANFERGLGKGTVLLFVYVLT